MPNRIPKVRIDVEPVMVDTETAARLLSMAPGTLENWRYDKKHPDRGPEWVRVRNKVLYPVAGIEDYLNRKLAEKYGTKGAGA